jgi:hypothetical protein
MAERQFKVGNPIKIVYQAPNRESGQTIVAEIILPNDAKDSAFPDLTLNELFSTGIYYGSFTPDQTGEWEVIIHKASGDGQVVKRYSVGGYNVHSLGTKVDALETKIDNIETKVNTLDTPPMVS